MLKRYIYLRDGSDHPSEGNLLLKPRIMGLRRADRYWRTPRVSTLTDLFALLLLLRYRHRHACLPGCWFIAPRHIIVDQDQKEREEGIYFSRLLRFLFA